MADGRNSSFGPVMAPTGLPSDFDSEQADLLRRRKMAELLQNQSMQQIEAPQAPGARTSWTQVLAKALQGGMAGYQLDKLGKQDADLAGRRDTMAQNWIHAMPQDTPGHEATNPDPGMESPVPALIPTAQDKMKWAMSGAQLGKFPQMIAEETLKNNLIPKAPNEAWKVAGEDLYRVDPKTGRPEFVTTPSGDRKLTEASNNRIDALAQKADAERIRSEDRNTSTEQRREAAVMHNETQRALAAARREAAAAAAAAAQKDPGQYMGVDEAGRQIQFKPNAGTLTTIGTPGAPGGEAPKGAVTDRVQFNKDITEARKQQGSVADLRSVLKAVEADPGTYSNRAAVASKVPNVAGMGQKAMGLTNEQMETRASAASMTANITHSLYGSAFSAGEQQRAKEFIILPTDNHATVLYKLRGREKLEAAHSARMNPGALARLGASAPAGAPAQDGGAPTDAELYNRY